ncbi:polyprenyl synthetase family protein [Streptococcus sp. X13SY08]|nr:polyprenyl synthetase family protein [Streptococcus sp. X13SY08]
MKDYLKQIKGKTAFLFAFACQLGAWTVPANRPQMRAAFNAGQAIGMAFQLSDDLLDYQVKKVDMGKPQLQDIQNGIYTAPLLFAMEENKGIRELISRHEEKDWQHEELVQLEEWIAESSGYARTEHLIAAYLAKSQIFLSKIPATESLSLNVFLEKVMGRRF